METHLEKCPCKWCKGNGRLKKEVVGNGGYVECDKCDCWTGFCENSEQAIEIWNDRK